MPETIYISLMGGIDVTDSNGDDRTPSSYKCRLLLAYLCVPPGVKRTRSHLAEIFWPDRSTAQATKSLRTTLSDLRRAIGPKAVSDNRSEISLELDALLIDTNTLNASHTNSVNPDRPVAMEEFLAGYEHDQESFNLWLGMQRDQYRSLGVQYALNRYQVLREGTQHDASTTILQQALSLEPYSEVVHRALMETYFAAGERGLALAQFRTCEETLRCELDVGPSSETIALAKSISAEAESRPDDTPSIPKNPSASPSSQSSLQDANLESASSTFTENIGGPESSISPNNLPYQNSSYIGNHESLAQLANDITERRLVTLTGIGGIGKTMLALQVGRNLLSDFPGGVWLLRLASLNTPSEMLSSLASTLRIELLPGDEPMSSIIAQLDDRRRLLILDNFEHLLEARSIVRSLIEKTQTLSIVITSRQRVNLTEEAVFPVQGLSHGTAKLNNGSSDEASELFIDAARRTRLDFNPSEFDKAAINQIGTLVEGHPLALVIAANWIDGLSCQEIVNELERGLCLLETASHDVPDRHRSIRATFNYSWTLLDKDEQQLFAALSSFRGGFDRKAAHKITGASLQQLTRLVRKSLINFPDQGRYEMHELMRQFAEEQLQSIGSQPKVANAHCRYYLGLLNNISNDNVGTDVESHKLLIDPDYDNIRKAWYFAVAAEQHDSLTDAISGLRILCSLGAHSHDLLELLKPALPIIENLNDDQSHRELALNLLLALGFAYRYTKGYFAPELNDIFARAYALTDKLEISAELFVAMYGRWSFNFTRGNLVENLTIIDQWRKRLSQLTDQQQTLPYVKDARFVVNMLEGPLLQNMGELARGRSIMQYGLTLEDPSRYSAMMGNYGLNFSVSGRHWLAINQCAAGLIEQSAQTISEANEIAEREQNPYLNMFVAFGQLTISTLLKDINGIRQHASTVTSLVSEHRIFEAFQHHAEIYVAFAANCEDKHVGIKQMQSLFDSNKGIPIFKSFDSQLLADALVRAGKAEEAIICIDSIAPSAENKNIKFSIAENFRIKGDASSALGSNSAARYYKKAIETAQCQQAGLYELRATRAFAHHLMESQHKNKQARDLLLPALASFTEGHNTLDFIEAKSLILSLDN